MRILLTGADGQLAHDMRWALAQHDLTALPHAALDICDLLAIQEAVENHRAECIVNTAAFNRVDECEEHPERAFSVNAVGVYQLARIASARDIILVHFSTDYVFDGSQNTPYVEGDTPNPQSVYAISKWTGEVTVRQYCRKHFVVRTSGLYGEAGNRSKGGNFVQRLLERARTGKPLRVVNDQILTPTSTRDLAENFAPLLESRRYGLYHMTNTGECSWYEFTEELIRLVGLTADLQPTSTADFGARARRPPYSVLDNRAYRAAGHKEFRPWREALADYLRQIRVARV